MCWYCIMAYNSGDPHCQAGPRHLDSGRGDRQASQIIWRGPQGWRPAPTTDIQREALSVLAEVWTLSPDVRLGQLFAHLGFLGEAHLNRGLGYIEDDELIAVLYRHRAELLARSPATPNQPLQPVGTDLSVSGSSMIP